MRAAFASVSVHASLHLLVVGHAGGHEDAARPHAFGQLQGVSTFAAAAAAEDENFRMVGEFRFDHCN